MSESEIKILIVCSGNPKQLSTFISEQSVALIKKGIKIDFYYILGKRTIGYLKNYNRFRTKLKEFQPDIIHAHYGLSGLLANMQRRVPVVTTFHGSDINDANVLKYSKIAHSLSVASIFVGNTMMQKVRKSDRSSVISCGVETSNFHYIPKLEALKKLGKNMEGLNILFSSAFNNPVKNYPLAMKACNILESKIQVAVNLIELSGYSREQVSLLMNTCDCVLVTSFSEGSPQFIKEAMACNCPIVTTNIGDVELVLGETAGCFVTSFEPDDIASKVEKAIEFRKKYNHTNGRDRILKLGLDSETVALKIIGIYKNILSIDDNPIL
jgi:teichuronic acid biosynthesis glycosyltransferase TuaC